MQTRPLLCPHLVLRLQLPTVHRARFDPRAQVIETDEADLAAPVPPLEDVGPVADEQLRRRPLQELVRQRLQRTNATSRRNVRGKLDEDVSDLLIFSAIY
jgi:hypothetical protein